MTTNPDRKKFNYLIRAVNGAGKTMSFLLPILNSLEPGIKYAEDKTLYFFILLVQPWKSYSKLSIQTSRSYSFAK